MRMRKKQGSGDATDIIRRERLKAVLRFSRQIGGKIETLRVNWAIRNCQ